MRNAHVPQRDDDSPESWPEEERFVNEHDETCGTCMTPPGEQDFSGPGWDQPYTLPLYVDNYPDEEPF